MPSGFESDIFFGGAIQKQTHPNGSCPFFLAAIQGFMKPVFEEKEENIIYLLQKSVLCNIIVTAHLYRQYPQARIFGGNPKWQSILLPFTKNAARYK